MKEIIKEMGKQFENKCCLYVLNVEPRFYKFGVTNDCFARLSTHYRDMNFASIVKVFDCISSSTMIQTERIIKVIARELGELVRKYDKTEIIETDNIEKYLVIIEELQYEIKNCKGLCYQFVEYDGPNPVYKKIRECPCELKPCAKCEDMHPLDRLSYNDGECFRCDPRIIGMSRDDISRIEEWPEYYPKRKINSRHVHYGTF